VGYLTKAPSPGSSGWFFVSKAGEDLLAQAEIDELLKETVQVRRELIAESRLDELRALVSPRFDFRKLIRLCEELNIASREDCLLAVGMLTRALLGDTSRNGTPRTLRRIQFT
jgi:hypothetical protein